MKFLVVVDPAGGLEVTAEWKESSDEWSAAKEASEDAPRGTKIYVVNTTNVSEFSVDLNLAKEAQKDFAA